MFSYLAESDLPTVSRGSVQYPAFSSGEFRQFCKQGVELRASQPL